MRYVKLFIEQCISAQGTEDSLFYFYFLVSLLSDLLAQAEGTVDAPSIAIRFPESKIRNGTTRAVLRLDLGLQRLLHPSWALESASRMGGEVSSSVFVTVG